ncbi:hypothetical protein [Mycobacterium hubeiense]|uniref:hypothetical protein n=1 Tax=Mycobacterium hubeiense TaxID=1867256 RepID=UPI000C7F7969|nr:hypothetical protein [Mycobacterium sp. QGD 101]
MVAILICLCVAAVGVLVLWPGRPGTGGWWIGPGIRDSQAGRVRLLIGDALLIVGLAGAVVAQLVTVPFGIGSAVTLVVQLILLALTVRVAVRQWTQTVSDRGATINENREPEAS